MNEFWSWFIIVFTVANILACWWLIRWTAKPRPGEASESDTTGHVWDEDLTEYNNPMPRWWLWLFYITIVFGFIYLALFPGLGKFEGLLGWSQYKEYREEVAAAEERYAPLYEKYAATPVPQLAGNEEAVATGQRIFANNCAVCHGSDARGAPGYPNLADGAWLYGGTPEAIKHSILNGRSGVMPAWSQQLSDLEVRQVAAYVYELNGRDAHRPDLVKAGEPVFKTTCAACHGADGTGNTMLGAPDLTDDAWLYGGSIETIRDIVRNGRQGRMPAHRELLGEDRAHVVAAYVYSLSHDGDGDANGESGAQ
ncbi:cytochrome c oxidase, cbb3-type, subunit III [Salinisphaera sp. PC39]|uniref:cytochrome-c oxidase, cbb3-type subunit III n=1 Tax=Salinisphaera sp. PC39 TaxID=1304156 RepID=UPI00333F150C